eukprot:937719-Rhodomonas_salina.1
MHTKTGALMRILGYARVPGYPGPVFTAGTESFRRIYQPGYDPDTGGNQIGSIQLSQVSEKRVSKARNAVSRPVPGYPGYTRVPKRSKF